MPINSQIGRPSLTARLFMPVVVLALSLLAACEHRLRTGGGSVTLAFDGTCTFAFDSTTEVGLNGARCREGTGRVTMEGGRVMCTTFAELAGILRSMGALESSVPATADGMVMTIASSQGGRNAFVAQGQKTAEGLSGAWEGIHNARGVSRRCASRTPSPRRRDAMVRPGAGWRRGRNVC